MKPAESYLVVYAGTEVMFTGTHGDCLAFVEEERPLKPYIKDWTVIDLEDYASLMYDLGYDNGYDCGSNQL